MIRPRGQYINTFNTEVTKYLRDSDFMLNQLENGRYLLDYNSLSPLMFDYCKYCISKGTTNTDVANNALDFIIVNT